MSEILPYEQPVLSSPEIQPTDQYPQHSHEFGESPTQHTEVTVEETADELLKLMEKKADYNPMLKRANYYITIAVSLLILYFVVGMLTYLLQRDKFKGKKTTVPFVDALYFCIVTLCTVGYGDITPANILTKGMSIALILIGAGAIDLFLTGPTGDYIFEIKFPKSRCTLKTKLKWALGAFVSCIVFGFIFMRSLEKFKWFDCLYLSIMSASTVGFGDKAFQTKGGRLFACIWLPIFTLAFSRTFLYVSVLIERKLRSMMKRWVLGKQLNVAELIRADLDHRGTVGKSEYIIFKLKEMRKISEDDITEISDKFDKLDTTQKGKLRILDLLEVSPGE